MQPPPASETIASANRFPPLKHTGDECVVCGVVSTTKQAARIDSKFSKKKELQKLLLEHGGINIVCGLICRSCENSLIILNERLSAFRAKCQSTLVQLRFKRCSEYTPEKENTSMTGTAATIDPR